MTFMMLHQVNTGYAKLALSKLRSTDDTVITKAQSLLLTPISSWPLPSMIYNTLDDLEYPTSTVTHHRSTLGYFPRKLLIVL